MTQGPSDEWTGSDHDDSPQGRESRRVTLLIRTSTAVRRAHATAEQSAGVRAAAEEAFRTALENRALLDAEPDARDDLENVVRRFATLLRADGAPPEIAVRRVKSTVEPVIFAPRDLDGSDVEWRRGVASDVVKWFVEAYYAA